MLASVFVPVLILVITLRFFVTILARYCILFVTFYLHLAFRLASLLISNPMHALSTGAVLGLFYVFWRVGYGSRWREAGVGRRRRREVGESLFLREEEVRGRDDERVEDSG